MDFKLTVPTGYTYLEVNIENDTPETLATKLECFAALIRALEAEHNQSFKVGKEFPDMLGFSFKTEDEGGSYADMRLVEAQATINDNRIIYICNDEIIQHNETFGRTLAEFKKQFGKDFKSSLYGKGVK